METEIKYIFITSVGTANYQTCQWSFNEDSIESKFASLAIENSLKLLGNAIVLTTHKVKNEFQHHLDEIKNGFKYIDNTCFLDIPDGINDDECFDIAYKLIEQIEKLTISNEPKPKLILDLTLSLRHLPFIYFCTLVYLAGLGKYEIAGIYYGAIEFKNNDNNIAPIINLTSVFELVQLYQALIMSQETGNLKQIANLASKEFASLFVSRKDSNLSKPYRTKLSALKEPMKKLSVSFPAGMTMEIAKDAANYLDNFKQFKKIETENKSNSKIKLILKAMNSWEDNIAKWASAEFELTKSELERELKLISDYIKYGYYQNAIILIREWLVNYCIYKKNENLLGWLDVDYRRQFESALGKWSNLKEPKHLSISILQFCFKPDIISRWSQIADIRNKFAHAFMKESELNTDTLINDLAGFSNNFKKYMDDDYNPYEQDYKVQYGNQENINAMNKILITPLGMSSGVIYSGIKHCKPTKLIIITSEEARSKLQESLDKCNQDCNATDIHYSLDDCLVLEMKDPHTGFGEATKIIADLEQNNWLIVANEIIINLTGGTTAMQYVMQAIAQKVVLDQSKIKRIALVDKRPTLEQQHNPYVLAELIDLTAF